VDVIALDVMTADIRHGLYWVHTVYR
jgi:hypothetical protein